MRTNEFVRKDVIIPGLEKEYRILHITDSHVVMCNEKEGEYIRKYTPILNTQIPKEDDWHRFDVNTINAREILKSIL